MRSIWKLASRFASARGSRTGKNPAAPQLAFERLETRDVPATFYVTNEGDNDGIDPDPFAGTGTLRQAIIDAQQVLADNDVIVIPLDVRNIILDASLPTIFETMTIRAEVSQFSFSALIMPQFGSYGNFRALDVAINGASLTLENLTFSLFGAPQTQTDNGDGGTIRTSGALTMTNCTIIGGFARGNGGAIATGTAASIGHLTLTNCLFEGNTANGNGGAIYSQAAFSAPILNFTSVFFNDNTAGGNGGGIFFSTATGALTLQDSVVGGFAFGSGGGLYQSGGTLEAINGGFSQGVAAGGVGGGICLLNPNAVYIDTNFFGNNALIAASIYLKNPPPSGLFFINFDRIPAGTVVIEP